MSAVIGVGAAVLLQREADARAVIRDERVSGVATASLVVLLGALAYALMRAARRGMNDPILLVPGALAIAAGVPEGPRPCRASRSCSSCISTRSSTSFRRTLPRVAAIFTSHHQRERFLSSARVSGRHLRPTARDRRHGRSRQIIEVVQQFAGFFDHRLLFRVRQSPLEALRPSFSPANVNHSGLGSRLAS